MSVSVRRERRTCQCLSCGERSQDGIHDQTFYTIDTIPPAGGTIFQQTYCKDCLNDLNNFIPAILAVEARGLVKKEEVSRVAKDPGHGPDSPAVP